MLTPTRIMWLKRIALALIVLLILIQLIPINRVNPPVVQEVQWDNPQTQEIAQRACYDCHSNETVWPWYTYVAPVSLLINNHVVEGRSKLNFSDWTQRNEGLNETIKVIQEGEMPMTNYTMIHPEARLTSAEIESLIAGLRATYAQDPPLSRGR